jgi:RNA polymerase sigma-B factor
MSVVEEPAGAASWARRPAVDPRARARLDRALFVRMADGDRRARDELVERFLPLARSVARRYEQSGEPLEDLVQVASVALVKAIDRFDRSRGIAFSSYAVPTIAGELKRHFRDRAWAIRPPRELQERALRVEAAVRELTARLDRTPTVRELAAEIGISDEAVLEAMQTRHARAPLSLQAPVGSAGEDGVLQDRVRLVEDGYEQVELGEQLEGLLAMVDARARLMLRLRFERDLTQAEIGALLGVSQMQVSRIIRGAIDRLRDIAETQQRVRDERHDPTR